MVFPKFNITESMKFYMIYEVKSYLADSSVDWENVFVETQFKSHSLCFQAGPSETSEMDEKIALAKSYTGKSFSCIFLTSALEIECVSCTSQGSASLI